MTRSDTGGSMIQLDIPEDGFRIVLIGRLTTDCSRCEKHGPGVAVEVINAADERLEGFVCWSCLRRIQADFELYGYAKLHGTLRRCEGLEGEWRR